MFHNKQKTAANSTAAVTQPSAVTDSKTSDIFVRAYLDFDGTLTALPGSETVLTSFYKSLHIGSGNYEFPNFIEEQKIVDVLTAKGQAFQMTKDAATFLKNLLARNAEINIISKNHARYIRAVLLQAGITSEQLLKINIFDIRSGLKKHGRVEQIEKDAKKLADCTVVCDDDNKDLTAMASAASKAKNLISVLGTRGNFDWNAIEEQIRDKTLKSANTAAAGPSK